MADFRGNQVLSGSWGKLWINNIEIAEIKAVSVKITGNREDIQIGIDVDSKLLGVKVEGEITFHKVKSRSADIVKAWKKGNDNRFKITAVVSDPDSINAQEERITLDNCWFNDLDAFKFEHGTKVEVTQSFGATFSDLEYEGVIK